MKWYVELLHLVGIIITLALVWFGVVREKNGPIILTFTGTHGLHTGDVPILVIGGIVSTVLTVRLWKATS